MTFIAFKKTQLLLSLNAIQFYNLFLLRDHININCSVIRNNIEKIPNVLYVNKINRYAHP